MMPPTVIEPRQSAYLFRGIFDDTHLGTLTSGLVKERQEVNPEYEQKVMKIFADTQMSQHFKMKNIVFFPQNRTVAQFPHFDHVSSDGVVMVVYLPPSSDIYIKSTMLVNTVHPRGTSEGHRCVIHGNGKLLPEWSGQMDLDSEIAVLTTTRAPPYDGSMFYTEVTRGDATIHSEIASCHSGPKRKYPSLILGFDRVFKPEHQDVASTVLFARLISPKINDLTL